MKRSLLASLLGALLVMGVTGATALVLANPDEAGAPTSSEEPGKRNDAAGQDKKSPGFGPPAWANGHGARGHGAKDHGKSDADWKAAWRELTPAQREARMKTLAKAHAEGMERWGDCVAAAGNDRAKRAECEKPLPPGLAKRRP